MMTSCQKLVKNLIAGNLSPSDTLPLASSGGAALTEELRSSRFMSRSETGKRIERGLDQTKNGLLVNADVNGAANILKYQQL